MKHQKPGALKIVVACLCVAYILFLWIKKDILAIYTTAPADQIIPMVITSIGVSLLKVAALTGVILIVKWIGSKISK